MFGDLLRWSSDELLRPYLRRLKAKLTLMAVSIALMGLFGFLALVFATVVVFIGLSNAFSPVEAALILFGFCLLMCLGTFIVFKLASRRESRRSDGDFSLPASLKRKPQSLKLDERLGQTREQVRDAIARNKFGGLAAIAVAGVLIGSRPRWALGLARFALGRKLKQRARARYRD